MNNTATPQQINEAFESERARLGRAMTWDEIQALDTKLGRPRVTDDWVKQYAQCKHPVTRDLALDLRDARAALKAAGITAVTRQQSSELEYIRKSYLGCELDSDPRIAAAWLGWQIARGEHFT
jgi:hypothetical protein